MLKVILFLLAGAVVVALAWVLAGIPGHVVASIGAFTIETSTPVAILMLVALFVVTIILMRILRGVLAIPRTGAGWRRRHRLTLGRKSRYARACRPGSGRAGHRPQGGPPGAYPARRFPPNVAPCRRSRPALRARG